MQNSHLACSKTRYWTSTSSTRATLHQRLCWPMSSTHQKTFSQGILKAIKHRSQSQEGTRGRKADHARTLSPRSTIIFCDNYPIHLPSKRKGLFQWHIPGRQSRTSILCDFERECVARAVKGQLGRPGRPHSDTGFGFLPPLWFSLKKCLRVCVLSLLTHKPVNH